MNRLIQDAIENEIHFNKYLKMFNELSQDKVGKWFYEFRHGFFQDSQKGGYVLRMYLRTDQVMFEVTVPIEDKGVAHILVDVVNGIEIIAKQVMLRGLFMVDATKAQKQFKQQVEGLKNYFEEWGI